MERGEGQVEASGQLLAESASLTLTLLHPLRRSWEGMPATSSWLLTEINCLWRDTRERDLLCQPLTSRLPHGSCLAHALLDLQDVKIVLYRVEDAAYAPPAEDDAFERLDGRAGAPSSPAMEAQEQDVGLRLIAGWSCSWSRQLRQRRSYPALALAPFHEFFFLPRKPLLFLSRRTLQLSLVLSKGLMHSMGNGSRQRAYQDPRPRPNASE
jgi:hypothetical protein